MENIVIINAMRTDTKRAKAVVDEAVKEFGTPTFL